MNSEIKYRGVYKHSGIQRSSRSKALKAKLEEFPYFASIFINGHSTFLGVFKTEREAALAYDKVAVRFGRKTNILKKAA